MPGWDRVAAAAERRASVALVDGPDGGPSVYWGWGGGLRCQKRHRGPRMGVAFTKRGQQALGGGAP